MVERISKSSSKGSDRMTPKAGGRMSTTCHKRDGPKWAPIGLLSTLTVISSKPSLSLRQLFSLGFVYEKSTSTKPLTPPPSARGSIGRLSSVSSACLGSTMAACSRGAEPPPPPLPVSVRRRSVGGFSPAQGCRRVELRKKRVRFGIRCCCADSEVRKMTPCKIAADTLEEWWRLETKKIPRRVTARAMPSIPFPSTGVKGLSKQKDFYPRCSNQRNNAPQSRDTPPKRDTGIASEKEWGISLLDEHVKESGVNDDGSTWYRESGVEHGNNGYKCRWSKMGGQSHDGSSEWKETWWEKSDWTGYKELGAEKSGKNADGESWWETWLEVLYQDEWSNLARIERSAKKQAKSGTENAEWFENWWEKYDAKGWTKKGAYKYGTLDDQSWWEKWGEEYDGRGSVKKWTDKWAGHAKLETKWGDKWEENFFSGIGSRHGETWHLSRSNERWSRTWGEEHFGNGKVHKYGKSTAGEGWDIVVDEGTYYESEPHYGWADVVGDSTQLLSIKPQERPPGVYPDLDFGSTPPRTPGPPDAPPPT
ncbi:hypothetical protein HPP92_020308 [Vanilla planifolia]|uniref:Inactive purple acid phosphatase-like protein n=1 Tax=Vanilla planifolia TaxID=51239 RepID=A0A835Q5Q4_VANPL|nr:hypothetical protein HPP92_020308 [Vanilla planifolia]